MTKTLLFLTLIFVVAVSGCDIKTAINPKVVDSIQEYSKQNNVSCSLIDAYFTGTSKYVNGERIPSTVVVVYKCSDGILVKEESQ